MTVDTDGDEVPSAIRVVSDLGTNPDDAVRGVAPRRPSRNRARPAHGG